jgi:hypothetical protein
MLYLSSASPTRVSVPVILVFTKFDEVVSQVLLDSFSGAPQYHERARASAHTTYEESCHRIFDKEPRDVPAEIVSGIYFPSRIIGGVY